MKGFTRVELLVVVGIVGILMVCTGVGGPIIHFLLGWLLFLIHTLPEVRWRPAAIVQGGVAFGLLLLVVHSFLGWIYRRRQIEGSTETEAKPPAWRFRWSASCVVLVVMMFVAGMSMIVLVHQTGWLLASDEPWMSYGARDAARRSQSTNNLKQIGIAAHNYHDTHGSFPPGGTFNRYQEMQHGWLTHLLPYMEQAALHERVRWDLPWDHAENAEVFSTQIWALQNPSLPRSLNADQRGYALGHYAANARVVGPMGSLRIDDIADGTSQTILAGEVQEDLKPWANPTNWRDPSRGIGPGTGGFGGGRKYGGAVFAFADGSCRHVSEEIDPSILRALSTPAGGEQVDDDSF